MTQHAMNIALWKGVVDYFKIEIIHFMTDTSHKFAVNNTDIKIRNQESGILYFQQQQQAYISCYNWYHNMATTHSRMSIKYNYKKIDLSIVSSCE